MSLTIAASLMLLAQAEMPQWQMITVSGGEKDPALIYADKASLKRDGVIVRATIYIVGEKNAVRLGYEFDCKNGRARALTLYDSNTGREGPTQSLGEWMDVKARVTGTAVEMQRYACEGGKKSDERIWRAPDPIALSRLVLASVRAENEEKAKKEAK